MNVLTVNTKQMTYNNAHKSFYGEASTMFGPMSRRNNVMAPEMFRIQSEKTGECRWAKKFSEHESSDGDLKFTDYRVADVVNGRTVTYSCRVYNS